MSQVRAAASPRGRREEVPLIQHHLQSGRPFLWLVCLFGFAGSAWAQEPTPVTPAPTTQEPAPAKPAPAPVVPEPGSALAALLGLPNPADPVQQAAAAAAPSGEQPVGNGFVFGASLGVHLILAGAGNPQPSVQPGIAIGGKIGRAVLTLGAEFNNFSMNTLAEARSGGGTTAASQSLSTFLVVPGVQVAILRSRDGRVEFLGAARFGFGAPTSNTSLNPSPPPPPPSTLSTSQFSFMYEVGPGVRYWPHRHFALNLLAGFRGDYLFEMTSGSFPKDPAVTSVTTVNNNGLNGIFASLGGMGAF